MAIYTDAWERLWKDAAHGGEAVGSTAGTDRSDSGVAGALAQVVQAGAGAARMLCPVNLL